MPRVSATLFNFHPLLQWSHRPVSMRTLRPGPDSARSSRVHERSQHSPRTPDGTKPRGVPVRVPTRELLAHQRAQEVHENRWGGWVDGGGLLALLGEGDVDRREVRTLEIEALRVEERPGRLDDIVRERA